MRKFVLFVIFAAFALSVGTAHAGDVMIKPFAQVFTHYQYNISDYNEDYDTRYDAKDYNGFYADRTYLGLEAQLSKSWSANITLNSMRAGDLSSMVSYQEDSDDDAMDDDSGDDDDGENLQDAAEVMGSTAHPGLGSTASGPYAVYVEYAYFNYKMSNLFNARFGIIPPPWAMKVYDYWTYRYIMDAGLTGYGMVRSGISDLGVAVHGKYKNFGGYGFAVMNGEGSGANEADAGKAAQINVYVTPFQMMDALKQLALMVTYHVDEVHPDYVEQLQKVMDIVLSFKLPMSEDMGIGAGIEYATSSTSWSDDRDPDTIDASMMSVWADFWYQKFSVLGRYDAYDPNTENDEDKGIGYQDETSMIMLGVGYQPMSMVRMNLNYRSYGYAAKIADDEQKETDMDSDNYVFFNTEFTF